MIGKRFAKLTVIEELPRRQFKTTSSRVYLCLCDCGNKIEAFPSNLRRGGTKSCGCLKKETAGNHSRTHGMSKTVEYQIWAGIIKRCNNKNYREFHLYGGRGITVCKRWESFENFYADMGPRPSSSHSVDRNDVNGNYEPANCSWATDIQQGLNCRKTHVVEFYGRRLSLRQFALCINYSYFSVYYWMVRKGMSIDAVLQKINYQSNNLTEPMFLEIR